MLTPLLLFTATVHLLSAFPVNQGAVIRRVIAVQSIVVDQHGNRIGVREELRDADSFPLASTGGTTTAVTGGTTASVGTSLGPGTGSLISGPLDTTVANNSTVSLQHTNSTNTPLAKVPSEALTAEQQSMLDQIFGDLIASHDRRYPTMRRFAELAVARNARILVETGTARNGRGNCGGDGCSTVVFSRLIEKLLPNALLFSVDINPDAIRSAMPAALAESKRCSFHSQDSLRFLDAFAQPIDMLYLDSYDFDGNNPLPSQAHHLREILAAYDKLGSRSVVMVDDCGLRDMGKCKLVDQFLTYAGWQMIGSGYQRVYSRA